MPELKQYLSVPLVTGMKEYEQQNVFSTKQWRKQMHDR